MDKLTHISTVFDYGIDYTCSVAGHLEDHIIGQDSGLLPQHFVHSPGIQLYRIVQVRGIDRYELIGIEKKR